MTHTPGIAAVWEALGGDPALLSRISYRTRAGSLPARLPVIELARACVGACSLAGAEFAATRAGRPVADVQVDDGALATAFTSERHLLIDGRAPVNFAPLSRFWRTQDGWLRTHANYPHHRARLCAALGVGADASVDEVAGLLAGRSAYEVEETVYAAGGLAVALRTPEEWAAHPQGAAVAAHPLVIRERLDAAAPRAVRGGAPRVLDLTRVLAGPVATRTLALLGADVLRVDAPQLPEDPDTHADTGFGKRSTRLDLTDGTDRRTFEELLTTADVIVTGYRPGALDRFGLAPEALAERHPGLVVASVSAWGAYGPWGGRRGFDSLVQVATGIAATQGSTEQPGALPAQALDHGTGYLLAAGVLRALTDRARDGGSHILRYSLARTAGWLVNEPGPGGQASEDAASVSPEKRASEDAASASPAPWLAETDSALGRLRYALPPVSFAGGPADWARPPGRWGTDAPVWLPRG
ncbi:CoA transferase [Streptomyces kunmingensis]|uniref:CoA transferase n=1 Tax=Streptomyces kunmingensis TaxID=68225 RepID=A0ABU6CIV5_9ACTN|nr:CoA transferase [Streptomyces kunmingensis]MEB3964628.1 CoA transferase [Streptomyces kunmingensis]